MLRALAAALLLRRALFDTNVFSLVDTTKAVLPDMRARRAVTS
ncbi:hypothetical protein OG496_51755 [Streptomyces sp. NBC_00988]|nr:hypothetical protein OG496_51755 [Streptomyces sp. NBC_00988]